MKNIYSRFLCLACISVLAMTSCNSVLDEQPRSSFDPSFFSTEKGVEGGLTSLYAHMRNIYGQAYYYNNCETGTDEYTWGHSADGNFKDADLSGVGNLKSTTCRADVLWGNAFTYINNASGVIENGEAAGIDMSLLAEAYFFRAFDYFLLVQTFGGVPLDLGSGVLKFNTSPVRISVRNTVPEVYAAIFEDLNTAINNLPESPRVPGAATKNVARLVLSKAYLAYAWWLENPKDIPTYPECTRNSGEAQSYFQKAYDMAMQAINSPGPYALQPTFRDVNLAQNDHNNEIMLWADHTQESAQYNGGDLGYGSGSAPDNFAGWMVQWNYCGDMKGVGESGGTFNPVMREASQPLGRPWTRMAPIPDALAKFTDQDKDSRWDGTFTSQYRVNMKKGGVKDTYVLGANGAQIKNGETFLMFLGDDSQRANITYAQQNGQINAGEMPGEPSFVISLSDISRKAYPGLWKLGPYRTDYDFETELGSPNAGSTRPFPILKFSELYFVASEAAVKLGKNTEARDLINVIRARAGKWTYSVNYNCVKEEDHSAELVAATPATITIDFLLDERLREYWGEGYRWFDLVRTQTWIERASVFHISTGDERNPQEFRRDIKPMHYLRPIPQGQIDGLEMTDEEKAAYQNPGYEN